MTQSKPKRVLIFSLQYYPLVGGAEVALQEITDRIPSDEIEFHMIALRFDSNLPKVERIGNILVHRIGFSRPAPSANDLKKFPLHLNKHLYQFLAAGKAMMLHATYRYDLIWAMMAHSTGIPAGIFKTFNSKVRYLLTLQEGDPPEYIERLARPVWPLFTRAFTTADAVQAISTFLAEWAKRRGARGLVEVIPNAVDTKRFARTLTGEERSVRARDLGKREGEVWLVTTSRLVPKNAVDSVIRALPMLPQEVIFVVGGTGPEEEALRALAEELHVTSRMRFLGHVEQKDLPDLLAVCDIFIRPSRSEGMGISFIEAMAAKLPVIATQVGGIPDFLFDAKRNPGKSPTGFAVGVDSPEDIVSAVGEILRDPEGTTQVIATAYAMVKTTYDWNTVAKRMQGLFSRLLGSAVE